MTTAIQNIAAQGGNVELRALLHSAHSRFAQEHDLKTQRELVFGWRDRSVGSVVENAGQLCWLRTVWAKAEWAHGAWWTGNQDADAICDVAKPQILSVSERADGPLVYHSELMTYSPGAVCSPTPDLQDLPTVNTAWWDALGENLNNLSAAATTRAAVDPVSVRHRIRVFFGVELDTEVSRWCVSHGDLHWNNLQSDPFSIVDWEAWGLAPRGYDVAFLLCHSLAVPDVADEIMRRFYRDLETNDGIVSQLYVMTKLLSRADGGEFADLIIPIHRHADRLLGRTSMASRSSLGEQS